MASHSIHIPFNKLSVFHRIKFVSYDLYALKPLDEAVVDSIHVDPVHLDKYQKVVPARFDTAIINVAPDNDSGVQGESHQVSSIIFNSQLSFFYRSRCWTNTVYIYSSVNSRWALVSRWISAPASGLC